MKIMPAWLLLIHTNNTGCEILTRHTVQAISRDNSLLGRNSKSETRIRLSRRKRKLNMENLPLCWMITRAHKAYEKNPSRGGQGEEYAPDRRDSVITYQTYISKNF